MTAYLFVNRKYMIYILVATLSLMGYSPAHAGADGAEKLAEGDAAVALGDYIAAEKAFAAALELEPDNYRIMKSLAEVKIKLEKYHDADLLIDKILAMKVIMGKKVLVTVDGEPEPMEAELVDETVILKDTSKNNMRNYIKPVTDEPAPHYRLFFLKSGKMELIPKTHATIKYMGVPRRDHELVRSMQAGVKNKVMAASVADKAVEMVRLEGGCFIMGSDNGTPAEKPAHEVCVSAFKIDQHEVTQNAFIKAMETNPSRFKGGNLPVESVTWFEADGFCKKSGKRLPTEAEWEFAARGGAQTAYHWGDQFDPSQANFCDSDCDLNIRLADASDGFKHTAPVGSFPANPYGLHDMAGNVAEWVGDWMQVGYFLISPKQDPKGPKRKDYQVLRGGTNNKVLKGGAWETDPSTLRITARKAFWLDYRFEALGFRCAAN